GRPRRRPPRGGSRRPAEAPPLVSRRARPRPSTSAPPLPPGAPGRRPPPWGRKDSRGGAGHRSPPRPPAGGTASLHLGPGGHVAVERAEHGLAVHGPRPDHAVRLHAHDLRGLQ